MDGTSFLPDADIKMVSLRGFCNLDLFINFSILFFRRIPSILKLNESLRKKHEDKRQKNTDMTDSQSNGFTNTNLDLKP